jgi:integrase/recombinase XerD
MAITAYKTKKGTRYMADLFIEGQKVQTKRGFEKKTDAVRWQEEARRQYSQPARIRTAFCDIANPYLTYSQKHHGQSTYSYKRASCKRLIHFVQQKFPPGTPQEAQLFFPVDLLTPHLCDEYLNHLHESGGSKLANRELRELNTIFKWAVRKGVTASNPFATSDPYPEEKFIRTIPTREELAAARVACEEGMERALFDFIFYTAARPVSLFRLTWDDLDFQRNSMRMWIRKRKGGNLESYTLAMAAPLRKALLSRWQQRLPDVPYVFHNEEGRPLHKNSRLYKYLFKRICERANIPLFTVNSLRAYIASYADDSGAGLRDIQAQFGHKRQATTEHYIQSLRVSRGITDTIMALDSELEAEAPLVFEVNLK